MKSAVNAFAQHEMKVGRGADLLDACIVHQANAVGEQQGLLLVMRNVDRG